MPKRRTDAERDIRDRVMRKLRAWVEQYNSMAATFVATGDPEIAARLETLGIHMAENGTAAYAKFMQDDLERYTKVVDEFHLRITQ